MKPSVWFDEVIHGWVLEDPSNHLEDDLKLCCVCGCEIELPFYLCKELRKAYCEKCGPKNNCALMKTQDHEHPLIIRYGGLKGKK